MNLILKIDEYSNIWNETLKQSNKQLAEKHNVPDRIHFCGNCSINSGAVSYFLREKYKDKFLYRCPGCDKQITMNNNKPFSLKEENEKE